MANVNFKVKNGLEVGTGVTITATGIITATSVSAGGSITAASFYGDGSNLVNAGSSLSASSGSQRLVLTSLTSGTMTSAATSSNLLYNSTTQILSCTNISSSGIVTSTEFDISTNSNSLSATGLTVNNINASGIGTITTLTATTLRNYGETVNTVGNTGTAATINLANGNFVTATLTGNCTFTFTTGLSSGAISFTLVLTNDATPGRSIIWPPSVKWPNGSTPVRTTDANKTDVYTFFTYDNGTTWWGNLSLYNYS